MKSQPRQIIFRNCTKQGFIIARIVFLIGFLILSLYDSKAESGKLRFRDPEQVLASSVGLIKNSGPTKASYYIDEDFIRSRGITAIAEVGFLSGFGTYELGTTKQNNFLAATFHTEVGWIVHRRLLLGVGSGFEPYEHFKQVPIYAVMRVSFNEGRTTPFFCVRGGTSFGVDTEHSGGFLNLGFGLKAYVNHHASAHFTIGYRYQFLFYGSYQDILGINHDFNDYIGINMLNMAMGMGF